MSTYTRHCSKSKSSNENSNRRSNDYLGFKNDNSSTQSLEWKREQAKSLTAVEAARQAEAQRIQDELKALNELRASHAETERELKEYKEQLKVSEDKCRRALDENLKVLGSNHDLNMELSRSRQEAKNLQREIERYKLPDMNNLPMNFHGEGYMLMNCSNRLALDFAADNGTRCHGWLPDPRNGSQHVKLNKVNKEDPKSPWTINCKGRYLEFTHPSDHARLSSRNTANQNQEWYICNLLDRPGRYMFWNVAQKCYLTLKDTSGNPGCNFVAVPNDEGSSRQTFIPVSVEPFYP
ncbi:uncharacterized protein BKA55DRAFT_740007 [Fusarium redolens]|uniref:Ricin B lectin domain-containing protein n=1 Tax=Fusarium redolens TaxID=48865 RepID=A0A9P9K1C9_FUSRE|nr:uncharacterized protein BKA55DRAFT_740007 [Fusarium redolens]KAH7244468.1 hypothetical protein BKA55DRAFT_740007 [Fusarium redolens]